MEAESSSETSVTTHQSTLCHMRECCKLHVCCSTFGLHLFSFMHVICTSLRFCSHRRYPHANWSTEVARARVYVDWTQHITEQWSFVTTVTNDECRYCTGQVRRSDTRPCVSTTCEMKPAVMTRYLLLIDSAHSDSLFNPQSSTKPVFSWWL